MNKSIKTEILKLFTITLSFIFFTNTQVLAQGSEDFFHSIGKIYVVVAVIVVLFLAICAYLWYLDRKITDLEKKIKQ